MIIPLPQSHLEAAVSSLIALKPGTPAYLLALAEAIEGALNNGTGDDGAHLGQTDAEIAIVALRHLADSLKQANALPN